MAKPIFVLNGPNLNLLGTREPHLYGRATLDEIRVRCEARARTQGREVDFRQTNHEGELIDWVQEARLAAAGLVINPAGYGHTSVALHDALKTLEIPIVECHLSNPAAREAFRHHSYVSLVASGVICGLGPTGYELAIEAVCGLCASS
ncbi:MAG: 3-dehydroquinate dehydratase [Caulobacteraceae bacterium]|jgi:3-dehydroquinate dehydratase-2|nr:3-dehydroquinate dehydratase [Caulobacteraceae bacterium]